MIKLKSIQVECSGESFSCRNAIEKTGLEFECYEDDTITFLTFKNHDEYSFLDVIEPHIPTLRSIGADEIILYLIYAYGGQCNLEFHQLKRIAALFDVFCITCYESDTDFDEESNDAELND